MNTASLRAPEGYHLPNLMKSCQEKIPDLFVKFGGHPCAAGFSITNDNLSIARRLMINETKIIVSQNSNFTPNIEIPEELETLKYKKNIIWLNLNEITVELLNQVFGMDPFGQDFLLPNFGFKVDIKDIKSKIKMGNNNQHIKIELYNNFCILMFNAKDDIIKYFWQDVKFTTEPDKIWLITKPNKNSFMQKNQIDLIVDKYFIF